MKSSAVIVLFLLVFTFISCKPKKKPPVSDKTTQQEQLTPAAFDADSAYYFVEKQVSFGPRVPNREAHKKCADWLVREMKRFANTVTVQTFTAKAFDGKILNLKNIISSFNPENKNRILLCAHWDSRPFADHDPDPANHSKAILGANDGGSGVGVLMEIARQFSLKNPKIGVDIIFFDGEDYGAPESFAGRSQDDWCLGSQYWARNTHIANYTARYGILLDMVGAANATFRMEQTSMAYASDIMNYVWDFASRLGYSGYFLREPSNPITDDHYYINEIKKIPTIDIIQQDETSQSGFYKHWHTLKDDMSGIDRQTLQVVGITVATLMYTEQ